MLMTTYLNGVGWTYQFYFWRFLGRFFFVDLGYIEKFLNIITKTAAMMCRIVKPLNFSL